MGGITIPAVARQVGLLPAQFFLTSGSYTIPQAGFYRISAIGPGGSGGAIFYTVAQGKAATGGSGGSFAEKVINAQQGIVLNFTIPAAGAGVTSSVDGTGVNGNPGAGPTTISDSGLVLLNLSAPAGLGGANLLNTAATVNGGAAPANATGGDINFAGGRGGNATMPAGTTTFQAATGGGACGSPFGAGGRGGDCTATNAAGLNATGGGAVNGKNGGADTQTNPSNVGSGGAGTGGDGAAATNAGSGTGGVNALGYLSPASADGIVRIAGGTLASLGFDSLVDPMRSLTGGGSAGGAASTAAGSGAGSGGSIGNAGAAGVCGGSGGSVSSAAGFTSGFVLIGGGSGGATGVLQCQSAAGGQGLIIIERIG